MIQYMTWAFKTKTPSLSAKTVLLALAYHANDKHRNYPGIPVAFPSARFLAEECHLTDRGVRKAIRALTNHRLVRVEHREGERSLFVLLIDDAIASTDDGMIATETGETTPELCSSPLNCVPTPPELCSEKPAEPLNVVPQNLNKEKTKKKEKESAPKPAKTRKPDLSEIELPDWMPTDVWAQWVQHRIDIRHPLTVLAAKNQLRDLQKAMDNGHPPLHLISIAISSGWRGCVFEKHLIANPSASASNGHDTRTHKPVNPFNPHNLSPIELEQYRMAEYLRKHGRDPASVFGALSGFANPVADASGGEPEKDVTAFASRVA